MCWQDVKAEVKAEEVKAELEGPEARHRKYDLWGHAVLGRDWTLPHHRLEKVYKEKLLQFRSISEYFL